MLKLKKLTEINEINLHFNDKRNAWQMFEN